MMASVRRMGRELRAYGFFIEISIPSLATKKGQLATLYLSRKGWRLEGEVVPASQKDPEGWGAADKFTVVLETDALNATELSAYCRERGLYQDQVSHWRQVAPTWPWPACRRHLMPTQSRYARWRSRKSSKSSTPRIKGRSRLLPWHQPGEKHSVVFWV